MNSVRLCLVLANVIVAGATFGAQPAWAAPPTIDSVSGGVSASTNGEVTGASDCTQSVGNSDSKQIPSGSGPFSFNQSANPATANASCSAGSGTNSSSASLASNGSIDPTSGSLSLTEQSQGTTSASGTLTNPSGCVDFGGSVSSRTVVQFTIGVATPFSFTGTLSTTQPTRASYSLVMNSPSSATIFDQTQGSTPNVTGMLQPGTYTYTASVIVSDDVACGSGSLSDNFNYSFRFHVGIDHYTVELKAWIPKAQVVDPNIPDPIPFALLNFFPFSMALSPPRAPCYTPKLGASSYALVTSHFRGDNHAAYAGSYRIRPVAQFDWDGHNITNFTASTANFGTTSLDYVIDDTADGGKVVACTDTKTQVSQADAQQTGSQAFSLSYSADDPLVYPRPLGLADSPLVPNIDGSMTGQFLSDGTLQLDYKTDYFPSHGFLVNRNGVDLETDIVNDVSCLDPTSVTGLFGMGVLATALSFNLNKGQVIVDPNQAPHTADNQSFMCSTGFFTMDFVSFAKSILTGGQVFASAADAASTIQVAPLKGGKPGRFMSLKKAVAKGLITSYDAPGPHLMLGINPATPIALKATGTWAITATRLHHGKPAGAQQIGPVTGKLTATITGTASHFASNGKTLKPHKPDHTPPRTTAKVKISGATATVTLIVRDRSGVESVVARLGRKRIKLTHLRFRIPKSKLAKVLVSSIDFYGNREKPHHIAR